MKLPCDVMFKLVLEKAEEQEIKLRTSAGSWKNQESSRKICISALLGHYYYFGYCITAAPRKKALQYEFRVNFFGNTSVLQPEVQLWIQLFNSLSLIF